VKTKSSARKSEPQKGKSKQGNIYDAFAKQMLCRIYVFVDFLLNVRLMYSRQDQWREDALLIMFE